MPSTKKEEEQQDDENLQTNTSERKIKIRIRKRRYHPTNYGQRCVNAQTGEVYPWFSGTFEELRLYRVIDTTARYTKEGFLRQRNEELNRDPNFLYYDSPEQYAKHMRKNINTLECAKWHANVAKYFPDGNFSLEAYNNRNKPVKSV